MALLAIFPGCRLNIRRLETAEMIRMLALAVTVVSVFFAGSASAAELKLLSALVMKPALAS